MLNPHLQVILPPKNIVVIQQKESTESFNALFSKGSVYIYIVSQHSGTEIYIKQDSLRSDWLGDKLSFADYCSLAQTST